MSKKEKWKMITIIAIFVAFSIIFGKESSAANFIVRNVSNTNQIYLIVNGTTGYIGIGTGNPAYPLHVVGDVFWTGTLQGGIVPWTRLQGYNLDVAWSGRLGWGNLTGYNLNVPWTGLLGWRNLTGYDLNVAWSGKLGWGNLTGYPSIIAGPGLTGGGDLSTSRSLSIAFGEDFLGWRNLTAYPSPCPAGHAVQAIGDTLTCIQINATQGVINGSGLAGQVAFFTGSNTISGSNNLYWDNVNSRLGINVIGVPTHTLHVNGTVRIMNTLDMNNANIQNINHLIIADPGAGEGLGWSGTAAGWVIDVSPLDRSNADGNLNIYGAANNIVAWRPTYIYTSVTPQLVINSTGTTAQFILQTSNTVRGNITADNSGNVYITPGNNLVVPSGNVGIGTTSPAYKLDVNGEIRAYGSGDVRYRVYSSGTTGWVGYELRSSGLDAFAGGIFRNNADNNRVSIWSKNQEAISILDTGNVGIGTTAPVYKLDVAGDIRATGVIRTDAISSNTGYVSASGSNLLTMTPYVDNALGFRTPFKVEKWDGSTWVDITGAEKWGVLTDGKPSTAIALINYNYTPDATRIRFSYDFGRNWVSPAQQLVLYMQHTPTINSVLVEQADDSTFTTNLETLANIGYSSCFDCTRIIPTLNFWRRYLRITIEVSRPSGSTSSLVAREIAYYSPAFYSGSRLINSMVPIDWDFNKNVFFSDKVGIGTTAPVKKLDVVGDINATGAVYSVNGYYIGANQIITGARVLQNIASISQSLLPTTDNTYDLGSSSYRWRNAYFSGNISINNEAATGTNVIKGLRVFYAGDETQVSTTSTTPELKKQFTAVFDDTYGIKPRYINVIARIWNGAVGNTTSLNVTLEGCAGIILQVTSTTPTLIKGSIDVRNCNNGNYTTKIYLSTTSGGTAYNDLIEFYYVE